MEHTLVRRLLVVAIAASLVSVGLFPPVAQAGGEMRVSVDPPRLVLTGEARSVTVDIVTGDGRSRSGVSALRVGATAGSVGDLRSVGDGHWRATFFPPKERFPQYAVVSVVDTTDVVAHRPPRLQVAVIALAGAIELRGTSKPNARVRVEIGTSKFGPVVADRDGGFRLPVVVDPGQGWATAIATDALGNSSRSRINLYLPEVQRLHAYVFPEVMQANGNDNGWIYVTNLGVSGAPEPASIEARAARGRATHGEQIAPGLTRVAYQPPSALADGTDTVAMSVIGRKHKGSVTVRLVAGPPATASVVPTPFPTPADGQTVTRLAASVRDGLGNASAGQRVSINVDDAVFVAVETTPGTYEVEIPPRRKVARLQGRVVVEPQALQCWRASVVALGGALSVLDHRGIPCMGEITVQEVTGNVSGRVTLRPGYERQGVVLPVTLAEQTVLLFSDASGRQQVLSAPGSASALAPIVERTFELAWRVPSVPELRLVLIGRSPTVAHIQLVSREIRNVAERARVEALGRVLAPTSRQEGQADYSVPMAGGVAVDVVATDSDTGVSAWLRVE